MNVQSKTHTMKNNLYLYPCFKVKIVSDSQKKENKMILREVFYKNPKESTYI